MNKLVKKISLAILALGIIIPLSACTNRSASNNSESQNKGNSLAVALLTDLNGVDDKSFNQSAWEGLTKWGKEHNLTKGLGGYDYVQSHQDSDYPVNINKLIKNNYNLIYAIGYKLDKAVTDGAKQNPNTKFAIIDTVVPDLDNVTSLTFKDNESAYLAGMSAALNSKTKKIGFIGGVKGEVINRFEAGYVAGAKAAVPDIQVDVKYVGAFDKADVAKSIATAMYNNGNDAIYQAAGSAGLGVFSSAKDARKSGKEVYVVGCDRDQTEEGQYDGGNLTLTSSIKALNTVVEEVSNETLAGNFPGKQHKVFGLKENGVDISKGQLSTDIWNKVEQAKQDIIDGKVTVPEKP
ncbi:BMP family lipoprotein [Holzapfeliella sp. JNUCC 80]